MCGIFGLVVDMTGRQHSPATVRRALLSLARSSESRGKDSSGLVFRCNTARELRVLKGAMPLGALLGRREVRQETADALQQRDGLLVVMGHSRLVTNGSQLHLGNNQPVMKDGVVGIHNGIIVNHEELWARNPDLHREFAIDTEAMLALLRKHVRRGVGLECAVSNAVGEVFGTVAAAFLLDDHDQLLLATNNGSLYTLVKKPGFFAFASEESFLQKMARRTRLEDCAIDQVAPGTGVKIGLRRWSVSSFGFRAAPSQTTAGGPTTGRYRIVMRGLADKKLQRELVLDPPAIAAQPEATVLARHLEYNIDRIRRLRRCSQCILPETFPFIRFDEQGVCNYCRSYIPKNRPKPIEELLRLVEPYRRTKGRHDCIVPYSGGRDSTHTLHIAKKVLGLNPVAFTYDWGMVTDLARRNIARVCGKLGVENIIVSADIAWKRENIRRNIVAWLKSPNLGMVPLFMAGDKYFFYYTDKVRRETGVRLNIWGINPLENTDFKVGFLGVPPDHQKKTIYALSLQRKVRLLASVGRQVASNPSYLNRSVWDSMGSFIARSVVPHRDYYHMYDYYRWDEGEISRLVLEEYKWETAIDTDTTWRIGDGTAAFYNYIYYTVAGFSEYDTFRSNQIREGMLEREEALKLAARENIPRYASIRWYTDIVSLDYEATIRCINNIPKLYP